MIEPVEQAPVEPDAHAAGQRCVVGRLGIVEDAVRRAAIWRSGVEVGAGLDRNCGPDFQPGAAFQCGDAFGRGLVELEYGQSPGRDGGIDQRVVGIDEHADLADLWRYARRERGGAIKRDVTGGGGKEHEADMAGSARDGGVERGFGREATDFCANGHLRPLQPPLR